MKKQLVVLFLLALSIETNAQLSTLKAGVNLNAETSSDKLGKINYASWELSFERALGKKFSINCTYNYAKPHWDVNNEGIIGQYPGSFSGATGFTLYNHSLILEGRYYLKSNTTGIFFQLGIPFIYSTEERFYTSPSGDGSTKFSYYAICTTGGFGVKYPLSKSNRFGIEMSMNISPSFNFLDVDYGTSGFIKTGVKLFYSFDKVNQKSPKK